MQTIEASAMSTDHVTTAVLFDILVNPVKIVKRSLSLAVNIKELEPLQLREKTKDP